MSKALGVLTGEPLEACDITREGQWQAIAMYQRNGFAESSTRPPSLSMEGAIVIERLLNAASRCA